MLPELVRLRQWRAGDRQVDHRQLTGSRQRGHAYHTALLCSLESSLHSAHSALPPCVSWQQQHASSQQPADSRQQTAAGCASEQSYITIETVVSLLFDNFECTTFQSDKRRIHASEVRWSGEVTELR